MYMDEIIGLEEAVEELNNLGPNDPDGFVRLMLNREKGTVWLDEFDPSQYSGIIYNKPQIERVLTVGKGEKEPFDLEKLRQKCDDMCRKWWGD